MIFPTVIYRIFGVCSLLLLAAPAQTFAATVTYGFDGDLSDHFAPVVEFGIDSLEQTGGTLVYHNDGHGILSDGNGPDDTKGLFSTSFVPRYDQSWSASIDVTMPASYSATTAGPFDPEYDNQDYMGVGIGVFAPDRDFSIDGTMELNPTGRTYLSFYGDPGLSPPPEELTTTDITGTLTLAFDHTTKVMTWSGGGTELLSIDIDAGTDGRTVWPMSGSDPFTIAIFGTSEFEAISASEPLLLDNFVGITFESNSNPATPEPSSLLLVLGVLTLGLRRSRRAK